MEMTVGIVDGDTHMNEPPDLWRKRVPEKLRARAPRVVDVSNDRQAWLFDGGKTATITPLCNAVGEAPINWKIFSKGYDDTFRAGAWDPAARLADMDLDMTEVHVLYPTYALSGARGFSKDREVQLACVRAYNDWLSEFASHDPKRLIGVAILPVTGVDDAIEEATRVRKLPGMRAVLASAWPNGSKHPKLDEDDRFWSALEDLDLALDIHVGFDVGGEVEAGGEASDRGPDLLARITLSMLNEERQAVSMIPVLGHLILDGVLERHPRLRVGLAEVGAGWIPFFLEQTNDNFKRHRFWTRCGLKALPSEYWFRQCFATFQIDSYAVRNRDLVGVHTMMWSSDYPHTGADWPNSRSTIANQMAGVPEAEQRLILRDNARRLYGIAS
jgi:predicted TIM-barrel fold metal-dependent hydrolase